MKEEYLEIEEYDLGQTTNNYPEYTQNNAKLSPKRQDAGQSHFANTTQQTHLNETFPLQPHDFDGHSDDLMLRKLLNKFQMSFLYPFFKAYDVTYRSLRYLSVNDINAVIRSVGHRAEFREKLFTWRRKRYRTNDIIIECEKSPVQLSASEAPNTTRDSFYAKKRQLSTTATLCDNMIDATQDDSTNRFFQNDVQSIKRAASDFDSSSLQDMIDELPLEIELAAVAAKRSKTETVVELRDTRICSQLNLQSVLDDSVFGPIMVAFYNKHGYLERKHRDELIQTIVDYVISKEIKLHSSDFGKIVDMIVNIFPTEEECRDYYFINRKGKRNPMGRLYTKYYNTLKRLRVRDIHQEFTQDTSPYLQGVALSDETTPTTGPTSTKTTATRTLTMKPANATNANDANNISNSCNNNPNDGNSNNTQIELIEDEFEELIQLDDTSVSAIKNFLRCQGLNWDDVKTMWSKTYLSRQEDIEHSSIKDVLLQWPKYLSARGMELFDIDFGLKYSRNKANILQRKWPHFMKKMCQYYKTNIKDEMCKGLFALWKTSPGKDTEDFIIAALLNSVMIPMGRYRDALGNRRKVSIVEAVDLFAIRVNHLEELDQKREEFSIKYGDMHTEFTPLIVVVGDNNINIHEIYVHFDVALYEMPDFVSALDCCMKIYRILNVPFPACNEYVWTFIQRYFYEIILPDDIKCPSMSSLMTFLKF